MFFLALCFAACVCVYIYIKKNQSTQQNIQEQDTAYLRFYCIEGCNLV
jgi:hypothetical protein